MTKRRDELTSQDRKDLPVFTGVLKYFPDALLEVAELSRIANDKHNPGEPLHWSKGKSNDHGDALVRHQLDAGKWDNLEGHRVRHSTEVAWRALAQLQTEIENEQAQQKAQFVGQGQRVVAEVEQVEINQAPEFYEPWQLPKQGWYPKGVPDQRRRDINED